MPFLNVKVIEDVFTSAQKKEIIEKLTDAIVSIGGENLRHAVVVIIEEVKCGDWAFGGRCITAADVEQMAARKPQQAEEMAGAGKER